MGVMLVKTNGNRSASLFHRAKVRFKAHKKARIPVGIGFLIDATASREESWEQAQIIQAKMFKSVSALRKFELRLVHFSGAGVRDHGWCDDPDSVAAEMAEVRCVGGQTAINSGLNAFLQEGQKADAIIVIGDSFEEERDEELIGELRDRGIRLFCFQEREDVRAKRVFLWMAEQTNGRYARFGDELPLADLCEGVALLTAGGDSSLENLENEKVRLLLAGPRKEDGNDR